MRGTCLSSNTHPAPFRGVGRDGVMCEETIKRSFAGAILQAVFAVLSAVVTSLLTAGLLLLVVY